VRVVIADDAMITREGIVRLLTDAGVEVVGQAEEPAGLIREVASTQPDAAVIDIKMPPTHTDEGIVAAHHIRSEFPHVGVLILSSYIEPTYAIRLLEEHPEKAGYLLKERILDIAVLVDALRRVIEGETVVDPTIVARLVSRRRLHDPVETLTKREREVLELVAQGRSNHAIAQTLFVTQKTVEAHTKRIFAKLAIETGPDSNRRVLAVLAFLRD